MGRFSIFMAAISIFAFSFACAQPVKGPKLEIVGGTTYDWGKVTPKQNPLKAEIKFKNVGDDTLRIKEVRPGCGCTSAPLDKYNLAPDEETILRVTLNIGTNSGDITKNIRVSSNEVAQPDQTIFLKANVIRELSIYPAYATFPEMTVGLETKSNPVKITNTSNKPITLSDFVANSEMIKLNVPKAIIIQPNESYDLFLMVKPDKKGAFNGVVSFKSTHPDYLMNEFQAYGSVKESAIYLNK